MPNAHKVLQILKVLPLLVTLFLIADLEVQKSSVCLRLAETTIALKTPIKDIIFIRNHHISRSL
jgi:hypothetical protein